VRKLPKSAAKRSNCPIATTLDIVGDKWTLLVIRDIALFGKHRYKDFQNAEEGIPTNILANRLVSLVDNKLLVKRPYQNNPPRFEYHLTESGKDLIPMIKAMAKWADRHVVGVKIPALKN
jgi:DNA-binding HxlR family transcriptional regulator